MKNIKSLAAIVLVLGLFAFQCEEKRDCCVPPLCSDTPSLEGTWRLVAYRNVSTGAEEKDPDTKGRGVVFTFKDDKKEGTIEGHTVANTISGGYSLEEGCVYTIKGFGGSKVGEPDWSGRAWLASEKGNYERVGNSLILYRNKGTEGMRFTKQ